MGRVFLSGVVLGLALLVSACGGSSGFLPSQQPFAGTFTVSAASVGDLSFTATANGVAGTGLLHTTALDVPVAISANVNGNTITGHVNNSNLGDGDFTGSFNGAKQAGGAFTLNLVTGTKLTGTWYASTAE